MSKKDKLNFFQKEAKKAKQHTISEKLGIGENTGYVDTGSYALNLLASGTVFGGIPNNSMTALAGETTTGKTFFALSIVKNFMDMHPDSGCYYADTEGAVLEETVSSRGMDGDRMIQMQPLCVEDWRTQMLQYMDSYEEAGEERPPAIAVLDSLGALSTRAELNNTATYGDSAEAQKRRETRDLTRPGLLKATLKLLRLKMGRLKVPMIITNHIYATMDMYKPKEMSGGSGLKYAADAIWFLSKSKAKENDDRSGEVIGSKITATAIKSRLARENAQVTVLLNYDTGLDRYYGLLDIALECGVFKALPKGIELPDGTKVSRKEIFRNPEKIYTKEVLTEIDHAAAPIFRYGQVGKKYVEPEDEVETEEEVA